MCTLGERSWQAPPCTPLGPWRNFLWQTLTEQCLSFADFNCPTRASLETHALEVMSSGCTSCAGCGHREYGWLSAIFVPYLPGIVFIYMPEPFRKPQSKLMKKEKWEMISYQVLSPRTKGTAVIPHPGRLSQSPRWRVRHGSAILSISPTSCSNFDGKWQSNDVWQSRWHTSTAEYLSTP